MKEMYFTIAGCNHYYGSDFMEKGMKVKLVMTKSVVRQRERLCL